MMAGWLHPSAKGHSLMGCEYKNLKVEVNIIMPWVYRALFFVDPQAFLQYNPAFSGQNDQAKLKSHSAIVLQGEKESRKRSKYYPRDLPG